MSESVFRTIRAPVNQGSSGGGCEGGPFFMGCIKKWWAVQEDRFAIDAVKGGWFESRFGKA